VSTLQDERLGSARSWGVTPSSHQKLNLCVWQLESITYPGVVPLLPTKLCVTKSKSRGNISKGRKLNAPAIRFNT